LPPIIKRMRRKRKRKKLNLRPVLFCLFMTAGAAVLQAQESGDGAREVLAAASKLEAEGKTVEAAALCLKWLKQNPESDQLFSVLVEALKLETDIEAALSLLETFTPAVRNLQDRHTLLYNRALILEMLGRLEEADALYAELPAYGQVLYKRALLLYERGDLQEAEKHLLAVEAEVEDKEILARALSLRARLYLKQGRKEEAEQTYQRLQSEFSEAACAPVFLLFYFEYLLKEERRPEARDLLETLKRKYPGSPEYHLALMSWEGESPGDREAGILYAPAPWRLLAPLQDGVWGAGDAAESEPAEPQAEAETRVESAPEAPAEAVTTPPEPFPEVWVQAGSFSVAENAHYLKRDLTAKGFEVRIAEVSVAGKTYYRVLIGPAGSPEDAQQQLLRLKDAGFEGVLFWEED
jgi:tetratricopeptide (TPR) repeat protein